MNLDNFYSLRKDFIILGLTGRAGSGCSKIAEELRDPQFISNLKYKPKNPLLEAEAIKFDICYNYLSVKDNFNSFTTISYKNVLLIHLVFESSKEEIPVDYFLNTLCQYGDNTIPYINRFGRIEDALQIDEIKSFLNEKLEGQTSIFLKTKEFERISDWLRSDNADDFINHFFDGFQSFAFDFYKLVNDLNPTKRTRFLHDIAINLREVGKCLQIPKKECNHLDNIYTVSETINTIVKLWRAKNNGKAQIVIDSLKNSLELMYFKEKYSGFYMIAVNKSEVERKKYLDEVVHKNHINEIINLDNAEYKGDDVNNGEFTVPDIENCIQKSDYHIFHNLESDINGGEKFLNLQYQLVKLLGLINQPGIITPTAIERTMQIAFNAKYNSGCISRQVGAVITDERFSVKSIGWNDVAQNQMPCKLRSVEKFVKGDSDALFSEYELKGRGKWLNKEVKENFKELVKEDVDEAKLENLNGRNCSFCFKSFQNTYEGEKNQVHTRSLHAEENAMMQIAKNGGNGLKNGLLFTTASPCELCSKKAFQLGIERIYYIDPYPGIAMTHTLKNGIKGSGNPEMEMFRGAVGRVFHKLYEPFMSHKDELRILTGFEPKERPIPINDIIDGLEIDDIKKSKIRDILVENKTS
ncbi:hypothetical protein [Winogradskyella sp.]|uniref:hypothetical protein n=1 Tax=Winogradskyella sp. TaxID=1883156 RepID=UPI003AB389A2